MANYLVSFIDRLAKKPALSVPALHCVLTIISHRRIEDMAIAWQKELTRVA